MVATKRKGSGEMNGLLRNKGYITLMLAQAISSIGDWLSIIAVITLVGLKWNASPMEVSLVMFCMATPMALLGPVSGVVADRFSRKTLMVVSDLVRGVLILLLAIAESLWMVYLILFTIGIFSSIFVPAKNGKLKELVGQESMKSAMSITSMIDSSTKIIGPLLSGLLVAIIGSKPVFIVDSVTFFVSALLILLLPTVIRLPEDIFEKKETIQFSFKEEFHYGLSFIKSNTFLLTGLFFLGMSMLVLQVSDTQFIVLIRELTEASPDLFGYLVTSSGIGTLISGIILAKKTNYNAFLLMLLGVCGIGISFGMMGLFTHYDFDMSILWAPIFGLLAGLAVGLVFVPFQASVQTETPVHMTGRVFGVINSVTTTATIIGPLVGGWLSTIIGVIPTFLITGSTLVILSLIAFLSNRKTERGNVNVSQSQQGAPGTTTS